MACRPVWMVLGLLALVSATEACGGDDASTSKPDLTEQARTSLSNSFGIELPADAAEHVCVENEDDAVAYMLSIGATDFQNRGILVPAENTAGWVAGEACPDVRDRWAITGLNELQDECDAMSAEEARENAGCEALSEMNEQIIEQSD